MITKINQITDGSVLLDVSALLASILNEHDGAHVSISTELHFFLDRCHTSKIHAWVAPEAATRLWKTLGMIGEKMKSGENFPTASKLKHKPKVLHHVQAAQRMREFSRCPFHLLRISSATLERAVNLWEKTGAGIEACVALCAFQEISKPPYRVVTANDHYDELASKDVFILKPSDLKKTHSEFKARPKEALKRGELMI